MDRMLAGTAGRVKKRDFGMVGARGTEKRSGRPNEGPPAHPWRMCRRAFGLFRGGCRTGQGVLGAEVLVHDPVLDTGLGPTPLGRWRGRRRYGLAGSGRGTLIVLLF